MATSNAALSKLFREFDALVTQLESNHLAEGNADLALASARDAAAAARDARAATQRLLNEKRAAIRAALSGDA